MINAFWWPKRMQRRCYKVLVRPTLFGEFLVFPYGYQAEGLGYIMSLSQKKRMEQPIWNVWDIPLFMASLLLFWGALAAGIWVLLGFVPLLGVWYWLARQRYDARVDDVTPKARLAPVRLRRDRYRVEYASQIPRWELLLGFALSALLLMSGGVLGGVALSKLDQRWWLGSALTLLILGGWMGKHTYHRWRDRRRAIMFSVVAGDPVYFPLPAVVEDENSSDAG